MCNTSRSRSYNFSETRKRKVHNNFILLSSIFLSKLPVDFLCCTETTIVVIMSKARELLKNEKKASSSSSSMAKIGEWVRKVTAFATTSGLEWGSWTYKHSRTIGWWIVTTGMITALPLIFEVSFRDCFVSTHAILHCLGVTFPSFFVCHLTTLIFFPSVFQ